MGIGILGCGILGYWEIGLFFREIASRFSAFRNDIVRSLSQTNLSCQYKYMIALVSKRNSIIYVK